MSDTTNHLERAEMLEYFEGEVADMRALELEQHFAACKDCAREARAIRKLSVALCGLRIPKVRAAQWQQRVKLAFSVAAEASEYGAWLGRIRTWSDKGLGRFGAAVRVFMAETGKPSGIVLDALDKLRAPASVLRFVAGSAVVPAHGGQSVSKSELTDVVVAMDDPETRVSIIRGQGEVVVRLGGEWKRGESPLVVLVPRDVDCGALVVEAVRIQNGGFEARFEQVSTGDYLVIVEPEPDAV